MEVSTLNPTPNERWFRRTEAKAKILLSHLPLHLIRSGSMERILIIRLVM